MSEDVFVTHDGLKFRARVEGPEGAPWVVFSNSLMTDVGVWEAQAKALRDTHRVLRYDQRGHGLTEAPDHPANFEELGGDLIALLDHFGVERCAFVGLSMGVPTGLHLLREQPDRVDRVVFTDGQSATAPGGFESWGLRIEGAQRDGMVANAEATMARWFSPTFVAAGGAEALRKSAEAMPLAGFVACATALQGYDYRAVLPEIKVPALLIAGENDGKMPESMRVFAEAIPGARFEIVPGAGHIPNVEQAAHYTRLLTGFLTS